MAEILVISILTVIFVKYKLSSLQFTMGKTDTHHDHTCSKVCCELVTARLLLSLCIDNMKYICTVSSPIVNSMRDFIKMDNKRGNWPTRRNKITKSNNFN